jgi:hypothetical protein
MDTPPTPQPRIPVDRERIAAFCQKWKIVEFALFGSVLTDAFGPDSDVDVLVKFAANADWTFEDHESMVLELKTLFGRKVDLVEKRWVKNPFRRHSILTTRQIIYAA